MPRLSIQVDYQIFEAESRVFSPRLADACPIDGLFEFWDWTFGLRRFMLK
jgi:hypothetical protein